MAKPVNQSYSLSFSVAASATLDTLASRNGGLATGRPEPGNLGCTGLPTRCRRLHVHDGHGVTIPLSRFVTFGVAWEWADP